MSKKQPSLFSDETGSPLFSNSPMRAQDELFSPKTVVSQSLLFGPVSFDDLQKPKQTVICPKCDKQVQLIPLSGKERIIVEHDEDGVESLAVFAPNMCPGSGERI
jgi:hypothetical protein